MGQGSLTSVGFEVINEPFAKSGIDSGYGAGFEYWVDLLDCYVVLPLFGFTCSHGRGITQCFSTNLNALKLEFPLNR